MTNITIKESTDIIGKVLKCTTDDYDDFHNYFLITDYSTNTSQWFQELAWGTKLELVTQFDKVQQLNQELRAEQARGLIL